MQNWQKAYERWEKRVKTQAWLEGKIEGDHLARLRLDQRPMSARKLLIKSVKHGIWALVAAWTAITFVGYFTPIRELLPAIASFQTGPWETFWLIFYATFTYLQAGLAREAVCQHMCPYSRFQGVMIDPETANVSYDATRGEPRGALRQAGAVNKGDCIDCGICVQVCPTGIDIRDGLQYQCINCGLCIDGCDEVMDKIGAPRGLIRFTSERELAGQPKVAGAWSRPRTLVYVGLLLVFTALGTWTLTERVLLRVEVHRDRGTLMQETIDGRIENSYTLKLINMEEATRRFRIGVSGLPGLRIEGATESSRGASTASRSPCHPQSEACPPAYSRSRSRRSRCTIPVLPRTKRAPSSCPLTEQSNNI